MLRLFTFLLVALVSVALLIGCTAAPATEAPPDPINLVNQAIIKIRSATTFRISVDETGPDYQVFTDFATVYFRRAIAQYVAPDLMQATVRVLAAGLPLEVQVFSHGADQWYRAIWTGNQWVNQSFAPDFNPQMLLSEDSGVQAALKALIELKYVGEETIENGAHVYHLTATANGPDMAALFGGLIEPVGSVGVEVYIDSGTFFPARFLVTEVDSPYAVTPQASASETSAPEQPILWTIDVTDINAPSEIQTPEASAATPEVTAQSTAEAAS